MKAFETGNYRNLFLEAGKTQEEIDKKLQEIWDTFFYGPEDERIYHPAGEDMGYLMDTGNYDARTEGMSYGSLIKKKNSTASGSGHVLICGWTKAGAKDILHGHAVLTEREMQTARHRTERNFLPWHFSLRPTDGETEKASLTIPKWQRRF